MNKVRLGIIGAGGIVQIQHLPFLREYSAVELVAICDIDRLKASALAKKFGIEYVYRQADDVFKRDDIDAVLISTPNNSHMPMALAAFAAKKHVLIERPIARNRNEAERMVKAAEQAGCSLMVAMNHRFRPDSLILQNLISKDELGEVYHINAAWMRRKTVSPRPAWMLDPKFSGGGVMMDLGIQMLDLCLWLLGNPEVESVKAKCYNSIYKAKVEDHAGVCLSLENGKSIILQVAWDIPSSHTIAFTTVHGETGTAWLNPLRINRELHGQMMELSPGNQYNRMELYERSYENEVKHFIESVRDGRQPVSSGSESLKVMKAIEMIYRSAAEGREVRAEEAGS